MIPPTNWRYNINLPSMLIYKFACKAILLLKVENVYFQTLYLELSLSSGTDEYGMKRVSVTNSI